MASSNEELNLDTSFSTIQGGTGNETAALASDGPSDSRCPICLERIVNVAFLNPCFHRYCFICILEWSDRKAECPLCKQHVHSFFHTIRSDTDFEEYIIPVENPSYGMYRPRSEMSERYESLSDNGILHQRYSSPQSQSRMRTLDDLMRQVGIRRSFHPGGISLGQIREQFTVKFRRALYQSGVRVRNVQSGGFYRDISADFFHQNPVRINRLVPWLKRELRVLCGTNAFHIDIIQHEILNNITVYDLNSQAFAAIMQRHLLRFTDHFLHEFINFARSPFNIKAYDWRAIYDIPFPMCEDMTEIQALFAISSSEEEEEEEEEGGTEDSDESEEGDGDSGTSTEEGNWDEEVQGSVSSSSNGTLDEYFLPTRTSDGEPARSADNAHEFFQTDAHLDTHSRHNPQHKCVLQHVEDCASVMCKSSVCTENTQHNTVDAGDVEEELVDEQEALRSLSFGRSLSFAHASASSNVGQLVSSNQMFSGLQIPFQEKETDIMESVPPVEEQDEITTQVIHHKGEGLIFIEMLQPQTGDILVIEHIELKSKETNDSGELPWQTERTANSIQNHSSTVVSPNNSSIQWDGGCSPYIRRP